MDETGNFLNALQCKGDRMRRYQRRYRSERAQLVDMIARAHTELGLSQESVARLAGVSQQRISRIDKARRDTGAESGELERATHVRPRSHRVLP